MRILTALALVSATGALLAQAPRSAPPPTGNRYYLDGDTIPADSLRRPLAQNPDSLRRVLERRADITRRALAQRPDLACPMPVLGGLDTSGWNPGGRGFGGVLPDTSRLRLFSMLREAVEPEPRIPTVRSGCYNPLFQPRDSSGGR